jgi:hypothetical protein
MNGLPSFITVSKGMFGFYICLADNEGPIERLENWNYDTYDECAREAEKLADAYNMKFL